MHREVGTVVLLLLAQANTHAELQHTVHQQSAKATVTPNPVPISWLAKLTPPKLPSACWPKMPQAIPPHTPHRPCSGQTLSTSSIFHFTWVAVNAQTNNAPGNRPGNQGAYRVHQVRAGTHRHQSGQWAVVQGSPGHYGRQTTPPRCRRPSPSTY